MTRHAAAILAILAVIAWAALRGCGPDDAGAYSPRQETPTPTDVATPTATVVLPTATDFPTPSPAPTQPTACAVMVYWAVAPGRIVHLSQRPLGSMAKWNWFMSIAGDFPVTGIPLYGDLEFLAEVPGPTATFWSTDEPSTETPTAAPSQTPWIITATPVATATAPPTASATATRAVLLPVVVKPRRRP